MHELLKQLLQVLWGHADPGIPYAEGDPVSPSDRLAVGLQPDRTIFGEFAGIAEQV